MAQPKATQKDAPQKTTRTGLSLRWSLLGSVLVHLVVWTIWPSADEKSPPLAIEVVPFESHPEVNGEATQLPKQSVPVPEAPTHHDEVEIVETEKSGEESPPPEANRLGKQNQTVEKETRASRVDDFRERKGSTSGPGGEGSLDTTGSRGKKSPTASESGGLSPQSKGSADLAEKELEHLTLNDLGIGSLAETVEDGPGGLGAATDDRLEGVPLGQRTALNTREFRYFSFYNRVKEELRRVWKPEIAERTERLARSGQTSLLLREELVTKVVAKLDSEGRFVRVLLVQSSGSALIDGAAEASFRKIGRFTNPPKPMVDRDGFIRLHWEFIVHPTAAPNLKLQGHGDNPEPDTGRRFDPR